MDVCGVHSHECMGVHSHECMGSIHMNIWGSIHMNVWAPIHMNVWGSIHMNVWGSIFISLVLFQVQYEDILAEPEGAHSHECLWGCAYKCFTMTFKFCYLILTFVCGLPAAFCWGCEFACLAFQHIWCWTPYLSFFTINCELIRKILTMYLNGCLTPCCESCGTFFSKIVVQNG